MKPFELCFFFENYPFELCSERETQMKRIEYKAYLMLERRRTSCWNYRKVQYICIHNMYFYGFIKT